MRGKSHRRRQIQKEKNKMRGNTQKSKRMQIKEKRAAKQNKMTHKQRKADKKNECEHVRLAITSEFVLSQENKDRVATVLKWYNRGILSDLIFLAADFRTDDELAEYKLTLIANECGWAWHHSFFPLPEEDKNNFLKRIVKGNGITHLLSVDNEILASACLNLNPLIELHKFKPTEEFWNRIREWIRNFSQYYYVLSDQGDSADEIIEVEMESEYENIRWS